MHTIIQPNETLGSNIQNTIINSVSDSNPFKTLSIIVAYAKRSGIYTILPFLRVFKENGGIINVIVGLSQRLTSRQALEVLLGEVKNCYVFFEENSFISFHPKVYIFENEKKGVVYLGSSNLTAGGMYINHELDVRLDFDLSIDSHSKDFNQFHELYDRYIKLGQSFCKRLDQNLLDELVKNKYVSDEEEDEKRERSERYERSKIFGSKINPRSRQLVSKVTPQSVPTPSLNYGFWKKLSEFDVSSTSAPGQIIIPIRYIHIFPPMSGLTLQPSGGWQEEVVFDISFEANGKAELVEGVRAIRYVPAPNHPRSNIELRFTFHNRTILNKLKKDDVLEFRRSKNQKAWFLVKLITQSNPIYYIYRKGRFGSL